MTLDAKLAFALQKKIIGVVGSHGVVTGDAGHHPPGPGIRNIGADRVGEFALILVTQGADFQPVALEQGHIVATVGKMAIGTVVDAAVPVGTVFVLVDGRAVAGGAHLFFPGPQQALFIAGMGAVAVDATVAVAARQVTMGGLHLLDDPGMAFLAPFHANLPRSLFMTGIASLLIGRMEEIADQRRPVAAMGVVAGQTAAQRTREAAMFALQGLRVMAGGAQLFNIFAEEHRPLGIMRLVAGPALAIEIGVMGNLVLLWISSVAVEALGLDVLGHQPLFR